MTVRIRETLESSAEFRGRRNELRLAHHEAVAALVANLKATMLSINGNSDRGGGLSQVISARVAARRHRDPFA